MVLPTPDMESCCKKERCLSGPNAGLVYDVCDPCQGRNLTFDKEACDCNNRDIILSTWDAGTGNTVPLYTVGPPVEYVVQAADFDGSCFSCNATPVLCSSPSARPRWVIENSWNFSQSLEVTCAGGEVIDLAFGDTLCFTPGADAPTMIDSEVYQSFTCPGDP